MKPWYSILHKFDISTLAVQPNGMRTSGKSLAATPHVRCSRTTCCTPVHSLRSSTWFLLVWVKTLPNLPSASYRILLVLVSCGSHGNRTVLCDVWYDMLSAFGRPEPCRSFVALEVVFSACHNSNHERGTSLAGRLCYANLGCTMRTTRRD